MSVQENIQLLTRWFHEVWNQGKLDTVYELLASDAVAIGQAELGVTLRGPQDFIPFVLRIRAAFPDLKIKVEDAFGADDKVALRWSGRMTHRGDALGMPGTGKSVRLTGITIARIAHGKIVEGWDNWDQLGMLRQIGVYPQPEAGVLGISESLETIG